MMKPKTSEAERRDLVQHVTQKMLALEEDLQGTSRSSRCPLIQYERGIIGNTDCLKESSCFLGHGVFPGSSSLSEEDEESSEQPETSEEEEIEEEEEDKSE